MKSYNLYQYNVRGQGPGYPDDMVAPGPIPGVTDTDPNALFPKVLRGSRGETTRSLQELLNMHGAGIGVDGVYGAQTQGAVDAFQRAQKLTATGAMDDATWQALLPELSKGAKGTDVFVLQKHLRLKGHPVSSTGNFGSDTEQALLAFQKQHRIEYSAHTSWATWARLLG